jgi:hypothetical protein
LLDDIPLLKVSPPRITVERFDPELKISDVLSVFGVACLPGICKNIDVYVFWMRTSEESMNQNRS